MDSWEDWEDENTLTLLNTKKDEVVISSLTSTIAPTADPGNQETDEWLTGTRSRDDKSSRREQVPQVKILVRDRSDQSKHENNINNTTVIEQKSFEERQREYEKARAAIFGQE